MVSALERGSPAVTISQNGKETNVLDESRVVLIFQDTPDQQTIPPGVSEKTYEFLKAATRCEGYAQIAESKRYAMETYVTTDVSTTDLAKKAQITRRAIKLRIISGMETAWNIMPPDLKLQFPQEEVIKMKDIFSPSYREKRSREMEQRWQDPVYRKKATDADREVWQREGHRAKMTEIIRLNWEDEETKKKTSQSHQQLWKDQEYRANMSRKRKALWKDEQYRNNMVIKHRGKRHTQTHRTKMSQTMTQKWKDQQYRLRVVAGTINKWRDPEYKHQRRLLAERKKSQFRLQMLAREVIEAHQSLPLIQLYKHDKKHPPTTADHMAFLTIIYAARISFAHQKNATRKDNAEVPIISFEEIEKFYERYDPDAFERWREDINFIRTKTATVVRFNTKIETPTDIFADGNFTDAEMVYSGTRTA